ncbi:unnamed protein product, partial [Staurois parvus]
DRSHETSHRLEAVFLLRLWQVLPAKILPHRASDHSYRAKILWVPSVRKDFSSVVGVGGPPEDTLGFKVICLQNMRDVFLQSGQNE